MGWACAIGDCEAQFEDIEALVVHQTTRHEHVSCKICGEELPDGFPALRHVTTVHTRAEYVRAYGATADDVRIREELVDYIEATADLRRVADRLSEV